MNKALQLAHFFKMQKSTGCGTTTRKYQLLTDSLSPHRVWLEALSKSSWEEGQECSPLLPHPNVLQLVIIASPNTLNLESEISAVKQCGRLEYTIVHYYADCLLSFSQPQMTLKVNSHI